MKKIALTIFSFYSFRAIAQTKQKTDSFYYLIDTAKIPTNARMWDIYEEISHI